MYNGGSFEEDLMTNGPTGKQIQNVGLGQVTDGSSFTETWWTSAYT